MPSIALNTWRTVRAAALDELVEAHKSVGGMGRGRRVATQQINYAYAVLLSAQFQAYCRDVHSECVWHMALPITIPGLRAIVRDEFLLHRRLDRGNPNGGNIGADFNRLGLNLWQEVSASSRQSAVRRLKLEALCSWRNAIAHQDFSNPQLGGNTSLRLETVDSWRKACDGLTRTFDVVLSDHLFRLTGRKPW